jgi:hypothetical protein
MRTMRRNMHAVRNNCIRKMVIDPLTGRAIVNSSGTNCQQIARARRKVILYSYHYSSQILTKSAINEIETKIRISIIKINIPLRGKESSECG